MAEVREQASSKPVWATQREGWGWGMMEERREKRRKRKLSLGCLDSSNLTQCALRAILYRKAKSMERTGETEKRDFTRGKLNKEPAFWRWRQDDQ